jgi:large subunit ribosomal protein L22
MQVQAIYKNFRMSPQKMREVVRQIQGLRAGEAEAVLAVLPRKSARAVHKTLKSAIANAADLKANNARYRSLDVDNLYVLEAVTGAASTFKRFTPKARGSAGPTLKRGCHVRIILSDGRATPEQS